MKVLVNGIGNIGKTVLGLINSNKNLLEIEEIYALKNTKVCEWNIEEIKIIKESGVIICSRDDDRFLSLDLIIDQIDYIFDCTANSFGMKNKKWYDSLVNLKGCSSQGSEKGFGIPFMTGVNNNEIQNQKYVQVVSCNTHAISSIVSVFFKNNMSNFKDGDFVVVRRSEDIGNHQRLVTANVVSRHLDKAIGTHHAIDVKDLFMTKGIDLPIQSSDITTPSQLMHTVRFNLEFEEVPTQDWVENNLRNQAYVSCTSKFDSNVIFELGRRYSSQGRIFSHSIINDNNILYDFKRNRIKGWAFIPQEGNTILSTIHAFLLQTNSNEAEMKMKYLIDSMIRKEW